MKNLLQWIKPGSSENVKSALAVLLACIFKLTPEQIEEQEATVAFMKGNAYRCKLKNRYFDTAAARFYF